MKLLDKMIGMMMLMLCGFSSCLEEVHVKNSLSVFPNAPLEFKATDNNNVTLSVTTDADKWSYNSPDWIVAEQKGNSLVVNVKDNSGEARSGSVDFNAGTAEQVKINVLQHEFKDDDGNAGDSGEGEKVVAAIRDVRGESDVNVTLDKVTSKVIVSVKVSVAETLRNDANVTVFIDDKYLDEYNFLNQTSCILLPINTMMATEWPLTIASGSTSTEISIEIDGTDLSHVKKYLLPLKVKVTNGDIVFSHSEERVNYVINKVNPKTIKQMVCFEFNDVNPLNALEYKLEDGSYFFDAVVLFSGNMGWDAGTGTVRFNARTNQPVINSNTSTLIKEWKTFLKPIHDAGIKVYMGILPYFTQAGITTLSYDGCKWFAQEMAQIIKECQLDGVFLDEEYVGNEGGQMTPEWSKPRAGGDYFAFQMAKQMDLVCSWPTEVAVYVYNGLGWGWNTVTDHDDHRISMTTSEYADIMVADYGGQARPQGDQTKLNCTGASLELHLGRGWIDEQKARVLKEEGYGWIMYFAFNPDPNHKLYNKDRSMEYFKEVARGCYNQELLEPTHYYRKISGGAYDPNKYSY